MGRNNWGKTLWIPVFAALLLGVASCTEKAEEADTRLPVSSSEFETYPDNVNKYTIDLPEGWEKKENLNGVAILAENTTKDQDGTFTETISVVIEDAAEMNTDAYAKKNLNDIREFTGYAKVEEGMADVNGVEAPFVIFTHKAFRFPVKVYVAFWVQNGKGYVIACTARNERFAEYRGVFQKALQSFSVQ